MKRNIVFVLLFALAFSLICEYKAEAAAKVVFTDVPETAWYYPHASIPPEATGHQPG